MSIFYTNKTITMNRGDSGVVLLSILNRDDTPFALPIGMKNPTIVFSVKAETDVNDLHSNMLIEEYLPIKDYTYYGYGTPDESGQMKIHGGFYPKSKTVNTPESVVDTGIIYKVLYDESTGAHNKYMFVVPTTTPPVYPVGLTKREYAFAVPLVFEPAFTDRLSPGTYTYSITLLDSTSPVQLTQGEGDNVTTVDNYSEFLANVTLKQDLFGSQKLILSDSPIARVHGDPIRRIYYIKPCSEESVANATASEITTGNVTNIALPPVYIATTEQLGGIIVGDTLQVDFRGVLNVSKAITDKIADLYAKIGDMTTLTTDEKTTLVGAINEVDEHADANKLEIGNLSALTTDEKATLVGAINEVDSHANTGISKADAAQVTADNATTLANTGISKAEQAQQTADHAQQDAETAQATADNATNLANTGISKADRAQTTANTAVDKANDAKATANEAIMKADGRSNSIGFMTAKDAVTALNGYPRTQLKGGDTIWIVETGTPDLWVTEVAQESVPYNYTTKDKFNQDLVDNKVLQIGYFKTAYQESDGKPVTIAWQNVLVKSTDWVASTEFADFPYEAKIELTDFVDYTTVPQVVFDIADTMSGNYAPICKSGDKCVYIYGKVQNEITLKTVITFAPNVNGASITGGGYNNRGKWQASTTYEIDDLVYTDNGQYVCIDGITSTTSPEQDTQHWQATFVANVPVKSVNGQTGAVIIEVPTKTSQLTNDSGFITANDIPTVPEALPQEASALKNGSLPTSGWITPEQGWKENTLPANSMWWSVIYGNGKFVAVARDSTNGAYSMDGITWTEMLMPASRDWKSVTYGNDKFVAVASGSANGAYSTDGINWTEMTLPASKSWQSVTYGDGKYVAVASDDSDKGAYSTDGITWTQMSMSTIQSWQSVTYGDGKFVAVAYNSKKGAYSTDGITWTEMTLTAGHNWRITYGNDKFVAVAVDWNDGAYSTDGITWTKMFMPESKFWSSVTYGDGKFVAVASDSNKVAYSTDGINWTGMTLPAGHNGVSVAYGDGKFVVVSSGANGAYWNVAAKQVTYVISDASVTANSDVLMELTDDGGVKASSLTNGSIEVVRDTVPTKPIPYTYKVKQTNASGQFTLVNHFVPTAPVTSVNGQTGAVTIAVPTKTSELENDSGYVRSVPPVVQDVVCNDVDSAATLDTTITCEIGDLILAQIIVRSALTLPTDWTLLRTIPAVETKFNQTLSFAYKRATSTSETLTVTEATAGRIYTNLVRLSNAASISYIQSCEKTGTDIKSISSTKPVTPNMVIWGASNTLWNNPSPYGDWTYAPSTLDYYSLPQTTRAPRLGTFIDSSGAGERTFTASISNANGNAMMCGAVEVVGDEVARKGDIPTKTSELTNDSGFITSSDIPTIPTKTSQLENDSNFAKTNTPNSWGSTQTFTAYDGIKTNRICNAAGTSLVDGTGTTNKFGNGNMPTIIKTSEARPKAEVPYADGTVTRQIALLEDIPSMVIDWVGPSATEQVITGTGMRQIFAEFTDTVGDVSTLYKFYGEVYVDGQNEVNGTSSTVYSTNTDGTELHVITVTPTIRRNTNNEFVLRAECCRYTIGASPMSINKSYLSFVFRKRLY